MSENSPHTTTAQLSSFIKKRIQVNTTLSDRQKLVKRTKDWAGKKIMVIGDIGLDEYILGEVRRISPEAPVPVLDVEKEDLRLGLSGNVAQNIVSLGGQVQLISLVGADEAATKLKDLLASAGVPTDHLIVDDSRPTTRKARVMAKHHHLVRIDYEVRKACSESVEKQIVQEVLKNIDQCDGVIIEDYAKGMITKSLVQNILAITKPRNKRVMVDPHRTNAADFYQGVDVIKPNFDEAVALSGLSYDELRDHPDRVLEVGQALLKKVQARDLIMTRGKDGMMIFSGGVLYEVPTYARQVFDVTGAGDTVIATLALGLSIDLSLSEACILANFAAGVVVGQVGCVPCSTKELTDYMQSFLE